MMAQIKNRMKWMLLAVACWMSWTGTASASLSGYTNDADVNYTIPPQILPTIDATNFVNDSSFTINFDAFTLSVETFEPWNTINYTNNGTMVANSAFSAIGFNGIFFSTAPGCGFQFDTQTTNVIPRKMAGTFYNPGTVRANSYLDINSNFLFVSTIGKCLVNASNIINPGTIELGPNSLIQLTGKRVDLTRGTLTLETVNSALINLFGPNFFLNDIGINSLDYGVGTDTNADWDPSIQLQPTIATSSLFNSQLFFFNIMTVNPATPYYFENDTFDPGTGALTYRLIRAVWLNDNPGTNVTASVYFGGNPVPYLGPGFTTVGWAGSYTDPATGQPATNYLYLNDFYLRGANTNNPIINGVPSNFTFTELNTPAIFTVAPATPAFPLITPPGVVTNNYSYVDLQFLATSVTTNASLSNPSGALSNLTSRIEIKADKSLDLSLARISGMNFLSLAATNQFEGAKGAQIVAPYADISLGVTNGPSPTNGTMIFSNVIEPNLPNWNGTLQAWSSDWFTYTTNVVVFLDTNNVATTNLITQTNEYRVLLVNANLAPTTASEVQNLILHATNDLIIGDRLNVFGKFSVDAQNLTTTVNGDGAASPQGELNLDNNTTAWQTSAPYLRNVTNNGAIRLSNFQQFGSSGPASFTNTTITPGSSAMTAGGLLSTLSITNVGLNDTVTVGTNKYTFVYSFSKRGVPNEVKIGSSIYYSMLNLIAAINRGPGSGTAYSSRTVTNRQVYAGALQTLSLTNLFTVTAVSSGAGANSIATTTTSTRLTWNGNSTLVGGVTAVTASTNMTVVTTGGRYNSFINNGHLSDGGASAWIDNFVNSGTVLNGIGSFTLFSVETTMTNDLTNVIFTAGGDVNITANNIIISNTFLEADRSLTLTATNTLDDQTHGQAIANIWIVGTNSVGNGIILPRMPNNPGDLLGTTITNYAPVSRNVVNVWPGTDYGAVNQGYTNNEAVGRLILDALGTAPGAQFTFNGLGIPGVTNALYVDYLELDDQATNRDINNNLTSVNINTNLIIYYAQAMISGYSAAELLNHKNNDHLRWVPTYAGQFSSTNLVIGGVTNSYNTALATSTDIDSDGDGIPNASDTTPFVAHVIGGKSSGSGDPTPFFVSTMIHQACYPTNNPENTMVISWDTIPFATNYVYYSSVDNLASWRLLTNFISPQLVSGPATNVIMLDPIASPGRVYRVMVLPDLTHQY